MVLVECGQPKRWSVVDPAEFFAPLPGEEPEIKFSVLMSLDEMKTLRENIDLVLENYQSKENRYKDYCEAQCNRSDFHVQDADESGSTNSNGGAGTI